MWVRGLKHPNTEDVFFARWSHPMWVRGLKHYGSDVSFDLFKSHPMWVRGLKQPISNFYIKNGLVAPYVGAWIETNSTT